MSFNSNFGSTNQQNTGFGMFNSTPSAPQSSLGFSPSQSNQSIFGNNNTKSDNILGSSNQPLNSTFGLNNQSSMFNNNTNQTPAMFNISAPSNGVFNTPSNAFGPSNPKSSMFGVSNTITNPTNSNGFAFGNANVSSTTTTNSLFGNPPGNQNLNNFSLNNNSVAQTNTNVSLQNTSSQNNAGFLKFGTAPSNNNAFLPTGSNFSSNATNTLPFGNQSIGTNSISSAPQSGTTFGIHPQISNNLSFGSAPQVTTTANIIGGNTTAFQTGLPNVSNSFSSFQGAFNSPTTSSNANVFGTKPNASFGNTTSSLFPMGTTNTNMLSSPSVTSNSNTSFLNTGLSNASTNAPLSLNANLSTAPNTTGSFPLNTNFNIASSSTGSSFSLNPNNTTAVISTGSPFLSNTGFSVPSTASSSMFGATNTSIGGFSMAKSLSNNASPLAIASITSKKGLGGSPISDSNKSVLPKDAAHKISIVNQVKDNDVKPELREQIEIFKQFVTEQKKLREEIIKSNDAASLMIRVEEESQTLRQSISEVANGLQKIQVQSNKLKTDITKEQSSIKIAQTSSETSISMAMDRSDSTNYFANKVRELENRSGLYQQEIEVVESMCNSSNKSALTTRDLVEIIRKMDDEFIGLAAKLYMVHERVKTAKSEYLRRSKQIHVNNNPFAAIEGRFGETFESIGALNNNNKKANVVQNTSLAIKENVGGSPFDNSCYINQSVMVAPTASVSSFASPKSNFFQKPSIFGIPNNSNNNNQSIMSNTTSTTSPFSFANAPSSFGLSKSNNLLLTDTVSNKKRR